MSEEQPLTSILLAFQALPAGYHELAEQNYALALANPNKSPPDTVVDLCDALVHAFDWDETREGYKFWEGVYDWANTGCDLPPLAIGTSPTVKPRQRLQHSSAAASTPTPDSVDVFVIASDSPQDLIVVPTTTLANVFACLGGVDDGNALTTGPIIITAAKMAVAELEALPEFEP